MGTIEDTLRETFAAEAGEPPTLDGVADRAILRARRVRRTHRSVGAAVVVLAVALAGGVSLVLHDRLTSGLTAAAPSHGPVPSSVEWSAAQPVDLLVGGQIRATDGRRIPLAETASQEGAYRVGDDWLVLAQDLGATDHSLWLVQADGTTRRLITAAGIAVSPDGRQVAWAIGDLLKVADLVDGRLINNRQTGGRRGLVPYAFAGEAVLLTAQDYVYKGTAAPPFDLWFPSRGAYAPGPTPEHAVYGLGLAPGGARLLGMAAVGSLGPDGREFCLAELDLGTLEPTRYVCNLPISPTATMSISPNGHFAMITGDTSVFMIDLATVFDTPLVLGEWDGLYAGPVAWTDANTVVASGRWQVYVMTVTSNRDVAVRTWADANDGQRPLVIPRLR
jgi:hypothetical protein